VTARLDGRVPFTARRVPALSVSAKVSQQQCNRR